MNRLNRDELILLGLELELPSLLNFCGSEKRINEKVCQDSSFWLRKLKKDFPKNYKYFFNKYSIDLTSNKEKYMFLYSLLEVKKKLRWDKSIDEIYNLKELHIYPKTLDEIPYLGNLVNLESLYLAYNSLKKILPLSNLKKLRSLSLQGNKLEDFSLENLPNLESLDLFENSLNKITLENLPNLRVLNISNNLLTNVSLKNLPNLRVLNISNNLLTNVSLKNLPKLEQLYLSRNTFFKDLVLENVPNLKMIDIYGTGINSQNIKEKYPILVIYN